MPTNIPATQQRLSILLYTARGVAGVSGVFTVVVLILLGLNYIQREAVDPLHADAYETLIELSRSQQDNAQLREQIRSFDLLARKAFFTTRTFARHGAYLLLGGVLMCLAALKTTAALTTRVPTPSRNPAEHTAARMDTARRWVTAIGGLVAAGALVLIYVTRDFPASGEIPDPPVEPEAAPWEAHLQNWPCFRGPGGLARAVGHGFPTAWNGSTGENIRWKTAIPLSGFNSPVVWDRRVFLSGADEKQLAVFCYDADTGERLWNRPVPSAAGPPDTWPEVTEDTGYAAPTMAVNGRAAFAVFATGDLVAFDLDGKMLWQRHLGVPVNHYGHASSLVAYRDLLLVLYDHAEAASLIGIDAATGKTRWETPRKKTMTWTSPTLADTGERMQMFILSDPLLTSYDPYTGRELWSLEIMSGEIAPSPAYADGTVYVGNEYPRLAAVEVETGQVLWENEDDLPDIPSPLAVGDLVIIAANAGPVFCLDARTGERLWLQDFDNEFYGSPVAVNGRVYCQDMAGDMQIFNAARTYEKMGTGRLGEKSTCTPAFVNGRIYIRGFEHLFCIEQAKE